MRRLSTITASALAVAALTPAAALAGSGIELHGAPTLRLVDRDHAKLTLVTSERLPRQADGGYKARLAVSGTRVGSIHAAGRHGRDFRYTGVFGAARTLKLGHKYTLRIRIAGQDDIVRTVKLLEERR